MVLERFGVNEVDVLDNGLEFSVVEFKAPKTVTKVMFDGLNKFEQISKIEELQKTLVYGGNENQNKSAGNLVSWKNFQKY